MEDKYFSLPIPHKNSKIITILYYVWEDETGAPVRAEWSTLMPERDEVHLERSSSCSCLVEVQWL